MPITTVSTTALGSATAVGTPSVLTLPLVSLPDLCSVTRRTATDDGAGGVEATEATLGPYACRLLKESGSPVEKNVGGMVRTLAPRVLQLSLTADVVPTDALTHAGRRYEVLSTDAGTTGATYLTAYLEWLGDLAA